MIAVIRLTVMGFLVLSVVFICVSLYSRSVRKQKLEEAWEAGDRDGDWRVQPQEEEVGPYTDRDSYMKAGLELYDRSLKKKLIWGVYVFPAALVGFLIYATNFM